MARLTPLISFVIPVYNLSSTLVRACLDSILALDMSPAEREIIIVDDGSDDALWEELSDYHDAAIYVRQAHSGLSVARNRGIERARGTYIQFVDGDDTLIKRGYDIIIDKLRKPDTYFQTDIILFKMSRKDGTSRRGIASLLKLFWYLSSREYLTKKNIRAAACGYVFRQERLKDLRFTPDICHEDEEFTPLLLLRCPYILFTSIKAYYYRPRTASTMRNSDEEHVAQRLHDLLGVIQRLQHVALYTAPALTRRVHQLSMDCIYNMLRLSRDYAQYCEYFSQMRQQRLAPLPLRPYTAKYLLFALLTHCAAGRRVLYLLLR